MCSVPSNARIHAMDYLVQINDSRGLGHEHYWRQEPRGTKSLLH